MKEKRISSNWTKPMLILMTIAWIIGVSVFFVQKGIDVKNAGHIYALIMFLIMVGITLFLAFSLSEVKLTENELRLKKIFGKEKSYSFDKIGYPSSFRFKRLKFTSVDMKEKSGDTKNYLILNNNALLSGERIDAEEILLALRKKSK